MKEHKISEDKKVLEYRGYFYAMVRQNNVFWVTVGNEYRSLVDAIAAF